MSCTDAWGEYGASSVLRQDVSQHVGADGAAVHGNARHAFFHMSMHQSDDKAAPGSCVDEQCSDMMASEVEAKPWGRPVHAGSQAAGQPAAHPLTSGPPTLSTADPIAFLAAQRNEHGLTHHGGNCAGMWWQPCPCNPKIRILSHHGAKRAGMWWLQRWSW